MISLTAREDELQGRSLQTALLLRHDHCPDHLGGMLGAVVLECPTRRKGIAERLPRGEQSALPVVGRGDHDRGEDYRMGDGVLVGPGHGRAEHDLDRRGGVCLPPHVDMCSAKDRLVLRRGACSKAPVRCSHDQPCAHQGQDAYQDDSYEEPHCSVTHLDPSRLDNDLWVAISCSGKHPDAADPFVISTGSPQSSACRCFAQRWNSSHPIQAYRRILLSVYNIPLSHVSQKALVVSQFSHNSVGCCLACWLPLSPSALDGSLVVAWASGEGKISVVLRNDTVGCIFRYAL